MVNLFVKTQNKVDQRCLVLELAHSEDLSRQASLLLLEIQFRWRAVIQRLMDAAFIVKPQVFCEILACFPRTRVILEIHFFILNGSPQTLCEDIIECSPSSVLTFAYLMFFEQFQILRTGKLTSLVEVRKWPDEPARALAASPPAQKLPAWFDQVPTRGHNANTNPRWQPDRASLAADGY